MFNVVRADEGERGAMIVLTAVLVPALVLIGALAFGVTSLWTGRQDLQRATDLGGLAAAANTPTVSPELPLSGLKLFQRLDSSLDMGDWRQRACAVAAQQFVDGRSKVATAFQDMDEPPTCTVEWLWESPLLAALAACAGDVADLAGCKDGLERELRATLPLIDSVDASSSSALAAVKRHLRPADKALTDVATQLRDACVSETSVSILTTTSWVCNATVADVLRSVDHTTGSVIGTVSPLLAPLLTPVQRAAQNKLLDPVQRGVGFASNHVPQVGVDLAGVAPALLTPRVRVDVDGLMMRPTFSPFTFDVTTGTTARRVIKSALVLPTMGIPGLPVDGWALLPPETQAELTSRLGPDAPAMLGAAGTDGWVLDPNVLSESAPAIAADVLDMIDSNETLLSSTVSQALCTKLPPSIACPVGDDIVDRQHLLGPFMEDVWDATRPPPHGTTPTVQEMLAHYADSGDQVLIVSGVRMVRPGEVFGPLWYTIKHAHVGVDLSPLLSELMFIPALDVVPAAVYREGDTFRIQRVLATTGLYKARLVK